MATNHDHYINQLFNYKQNTFANKHNDFFQFNFLEFTNVFVLYVSKVHEQHSRILDNDIRKNNKKKYQYLITWLYIGLQEKKNGIDIEKCICL